MMHMARSFAEARGFAWPADVACIINGVPRTWKEIHAERKKSQAERLRRKLADRGPVRQAAMIWVFFVPGFIYGGWHLYVRTVHHSWWVRECCYSEEGHMITHCMNTWPCGMLPFRENFYAWKASFAKAYASGRKRGGKSQGIVFGWVDCRYDGCFPDAFTKASND